MESAALQPSPNPSYPPLFHIPSHHTSPSPPSPSHLPNIQIPLLDLHHLDLTQLTTACKEVGLFRLANHGVPSDLSTQLMDQAKELLSLSFESKKASLSHPVAYFWGTPAVKLSVKNLNWLEGLHVPLGQISSGGGDLRLGGCGSSLSSFIYLVDEYGKHMARIARVLFDALRADLKLDSEQLTSYLSEFDGTFRVYRYPCCPDVSNYFGMEAHTDSSVLSIVNQDNVGGLQVLQDSTWFNVTPIPDTLIVNLGDMMQAISGDEYKSVEHRVLANRDTERISLCYFAFPVEDSVIVSSKYKPFAYKDFKAQVQEDIKTTGSKEGLRRFRIGNSS
ncbi:gibberellin 2-beta-dioxygenase 6-like [Typha angustifolia]|uniref:gibberellin 2-beta-dioxygenase 6-like n=1 Tax=Typha angustifolia TaxID=59011 RepID=UPI003C2AB617